MLPKKKIRSNQMQLMKLVDYMSVNQNFANGQYKGPMGTAQHLQQWTELQTLLKKYGPDKTVEQWRHTWRDLRKKAREDGEKYKIACGETGNNLLMPILSEMSAKILDIIGTEMTSNIWTNQPTPTNTTPYRSAAPRTSTVVGISSSPPSFPAPTSAPQQRHMGLGDRDTAFLNVQHEHTNVLRDILRTMQDQNEILRERNTILLFQERRKNRERLRQARQRKF